MFAITCDYLFIFRTKVDVKRLFNVVQDIIRLCRTLLGADTLRALILVKDYLCRKKLGQV
jgi:hypothetical protein